MKHKHEESLNADERYCDSVIQSATAAFQGNAARQSPLSWRRYRPWREARYRVKPLVRA